MKKFDIAVVGCTGKVGRQMITVLEERKLPYNNVIMFASAKSAGSTIAFDGKDYTIVELNEENIIPSALDISVAFEIAEAVKKSAIESGNTR